MNKSLIFLAALTLIAGISTTSADAGTNTTPVKVTLKSKVAKDFTFMSDLLKALKTDGVTCINYVKDSGVLGVREEGTCNFNKQSLTIDLFQNDKTAVATISAVKGMASGYIVGLNNWGISIDDSATAKILQNGLRLKLY